MTPSPDPLTPLTKEERDSIIAILGGIDSVLPPVEAIDTLKKLVRQYEATLRELESRESQVAAVSPEEATDTEVRTAVAAYFAMRQAVVKEQTDAAREGRLQTNADCPSWSRYENAEQELWAALKRMNDRARSSVSPSRTTATEPPKARSCNRHDDCDDADKKAGGFASHCHDDCCEECFGC